MAAHILPSFLFAVRAMAARCKLSTTAFGGEVHSVSQGGSIHSKLRADVGSSSHAASRCGRLLWLVWLRGHDVVRQWEKGVLFLALVFFFSTYTSTYNNNRQPLFVSYKP